MTSLPYFSMRVEFVVFSMGVGFKVFSEGWVQWILK
jgi:hypothetical protein